MATYYVRTDGNNANAGTGPATNQAWQTIAYAFANMTLTTGTNYLYIAPGVYRESVSLGVTPTVTNTLVIAGDPTASQFSGVTANQVRITGAANDSSLNSNGTRIDTNAKPYVTIQDIVVEGATGGSSPTVLVSGSNTTIDRIVIYGIYQGGTVSSNLGVEAPNTTANAITIRNSTFVGGSYGMRLRAPVVTSGVSGIVVQNCRIIPGFYSTSYGIYVQPTSGTTMASVLVTNCFIHGASVGIYLERGNTTNTHTVQNCIISACGTGINAFAANTTTQQYNIINSFTQLTNVPTSATTVYSDFLGVDLTQNLLQGFGNVAPLGTLQGARNTGFGTASNAPATDAYGVTWTGATPDVGAVTYRSLSAVGSYLPTERNASTITIAPGSTSQSIELYLGATGLTASTSGLSAYYNRTRSADVQITLVARNITQNWTSGGFAEVNANTMPGVYRLDIPNEALAAGADDVTVVVRGASGTNGAVMSIKLSSGGLTTAQTASAVWGALTNDHTTHGTYGWNVLRADATSKEGLVTLHQSGGISRVDADVHAIANDTAAATALKGALNHDGTGYVDSDVVRISTSTAAANELEGALLHNGTDYIDSNLIGGNSTRVFVGRFQLTQTGTTQGDIIEAFTTDTPSFELQLFDGDNNIVPVTGATLGLRILDVTSTVVETGTPTIEYGTGGIVRWTAPGSYVSIGCPAGMYRLFVDRTVSGTTTTFGPLQIKVQVQ